MNPEMPHKKLKLEIDHNQVQTFGNLAKVVFGEVTRENVSSLYGKWPIVHKSGLFEAVSKNETEIDS